MRWRLSSPWWWTKRVSRAWDFQFRWHELTHSGERDEGMVLNWIRWMRLDLLLLWIFGRCRRWHRLTLRESAAWFPSHDLELRWLVLPVGTRISFAALSSTALLVCRSPAPPALGPIAFHVHRSTNVQSWRSRFLIDENFIKFSLYLGRERCDGWWRCEFVSFFLHQPFVAVNWQ